MRLYLWMLAVAMPVVGADVYASVNGVQRAEIWAGMPVVIEGFSMQEATGWRIEVKDDQGEEKVWPWRVLERSQWMVDGAVTAEWAPGAYRLRVVSPDGASSWCSLKVVARGDAPVEAALRREMIWKTYELRRRGDVEGALRMVDEWLAGHREDPLSP